MSVLLAATHTLPCLWMRAQYNPWLKDNAWQRHSNTENGFMFEKIIPTFKAVNKIQDIIQKLPTFIFQLT